MNLRRCGALLLLVSTPCVSPAALARPSVQEVDEAGAAKALPAASEILRRFHAATNMPAKIAHTTSTHAKGKVVMTAMGLEGSFEAWSAKPARQVVHMAIGGMGTIRQGYDGKIGWSIVPFQGPKVLEGAELLLSRLDAHYDEPLKTSELYEVVETVGRETFEGVECYKLRLVVRPLEDMDAEKTKRLRTQHEFYEVESGLLRGKKILAPSGNGPEVPITVVMSAYEKFGDVLFATRTVQMLPAGNLEIEISEVDFDQVQPERFALPAEIARMVAQGGD